jgi:hypothetical protein
MELLCKKLYTTDKKMLKRKFQFGIRPLDFPKPEPHCPMSRFRYQRPHRMVDWKFARISPSGQLPPNSSFKGLVRLRPVPGPFSRSIGTVKSHPNGIILEQQVYGEIGDGSGVLPCP